MIVPTISQRSINHSLIHASARSSSALNIVQHFLVPSYAAQCSFPEILQPQLSLSPHVFHNPYYPHSPHKPSSSNESLHLTPPYLFPSSSNPKPPPGLQYTPSPPKAPPLPPTTRLSIYPPFLLLSFSLRLFTLRYPLSLPLLRSLPEQWRGSNPPPLPHKLPPVTAHTIPTSLLGFLSSSNYQERIENKE